MNPGRMKHRGIIKSPTETTGSYGGVSTEWTTEKTVWARIIPLKADEIINNAKLDMRITHKIVIWYYSSVVPSWRFYKGARIFNIKSVINDEEGKIITTMLAEETVSV